MTCKKITLGVLFGLLYAPQSFSGPGDQPVCEIVKKVPPLGDLQQKLAVLVPTVCVLEPSPREPQNQTRERRDSTDSGKFQISTALTNEQILKSCKAQRDFLKIQSSNHNTAQELEELTKTIDSTISAFETT